MENGEPDVVIAGNRLGPPLFPPPRILFWLSSILMSKLLGSTGEGDEAFEEDASVAAVVDEKSRRVNDISYWMKSRLRILGRGSVAVRGRRT